MSRRRCGRHALLALVLVVGLPALAEAQLFPNLATRKRRRTECCNEPPVFKQYRQEYYGYHPTCWRRFPPGWGCPSPDAPNSENAMREINEQISQQPVAPVTPEGGMQGPNPGAPGAELGPAPGRQPGEPLPNVPRERSPFDLDRPGARPGAPTPPDTGPVPPRGGNPGDFAPPPGAGGGGPVPPAGPGESASTDTVPSPAAGSPLSLLDVSEPNPRDSTQPNRNDTAPMRSPALPDPSSPLANPGFGTPAPLEAPPAPRRGFLGGLFDRFKTRR